MQLSKYLTFCIILILFSLSIHSQEQFQLAYSLKDIENNELKDVLVEITAINKDTGEEYTLTSYITENEISINRETGNYKIIVKIDNLDTNGKDFYYNEDIRLDKDTRKEALLFSTGTLRGTVLDNLDNIVKADLRFECSKNYGEEKPKSTDKYGFFTINYMPIGNCRIIASKGDTVGLSDVIIEEGKVAEIQIKLNESKKSSLFIYILIIFVVILLIILLSKIKRKVKISKPKNKKEKIISKRANDIMKTLNEKELSVVNLLLQNKYKSTQATIMHNTQIPKTTLIRVIDSLQNKKIIEIETLGKLKKVNLTNWFLDK